MDILIVSAYFPPNAPPAATRIGKLARYFRDRGDSVRVLTADTGHFPALIPLEIPEDVVSYVPFADINEIPERILAKLRGKAGSDAQEGAAQDEGDDEPAGSGDSWKSRLGRLYRGLTNIPDGYVGWYRPAIAAGEDLIRARRPDRIYVSLPPHTGLLVAAHLGRRFGIPVVAEYRDLWVEHPYYDAPFWRRVVERALERRCTKSVAGFVTVTQGWADLLAQRRDKPTALVYNGFDPADFGAPADGAAVFGDKLGIVYAGALYGDKRDPTPLFEALQQLGEAAQAIHVVFHTPSPAELTEKIAAYGLAGIVESKPAIPHGEVVALEQAADILLLLRWDHPSEKSVVAGKLFEYIGAGRPILSVGLEEGEAGDIIRDNGFGVVSREPAAIAAQLQTWLAEKRETGRIAGIDPNRRQAFAREHQFDELADFLENLL